MMWLLKRVLVVGVSECFSAGTAPSRGSVVNIVRMNRDIQKNRVKEKVGEEEGGSSPCDLSLRTLSEGLISCSRGKRTDWSSSCWLIPTLY